MKWPGGKEYDGEWKDDQCHGVGKLVYDDGGCFNGEFRENALHGKGTYTYSGGQKLEGEWEINEPPEKAIWTDVDGISYDVTLRKDVDLFGVVDLGDAAFELKERTAAQRSLDAAAAATAELAALLRRFQLSALEEPLLRALADAGAHSVADLAWVRIKDVAHIGLSAVDRRKLTQLLAAAAPAAAAATAAATAAVVGPDHVANSRKRTRAASGDESGDDAPDHGGGSGGGGSGGKPG
eukprot:CAMPEP_0172156600 /NCGR_PEP_ID=MMETSP1050-20130122/3307_1 /TAXON_ID=233186 /ORGANISM="Cryptomonas curvata, Strain CCAP979/52" /LENGTH=237 /DNA_ID=CAMNT_0012825699 /DNA_START=243 /DNA_END=952 /DNA_ORIENTATION=+